jgi:hypothetical protein
LIAIYLNLANPYWSYSGEKAAMILTLLEIFILTLLMIATIKMTYKPTEEWIDD